MEPDFTLEDRKLLSFGTSAEETIANYLGRGKTVEEMIESLREEYGDIPESIINGALMLVDTWYNYRSPNNATPVSLVQNTLDTLIKPYCYLHS